jgi:hypothetical protein
MTKMAWRKTSKNSVKEAIWRGKWGFDRVFSFIFSQR